MARRSSSRSEDMWSGQAEAIKETDKALLVEIGDEEYWIPKSQISDDSEVYKKGTEGELIIPMWLAEAKGLE